MFHSIFKRPMRSVLAALAIPGLFVLLVNATPQSGKQSAMQVYYLENVTENVDAVCATYAQVHGIAFGEPDPSLGGARTAALANGGMLGVRPPMRADEAPVVRSYWLVDDIKATVDAAAASGALVALPPMPLPGHGSCAIVIQGGVEIGYWQR